MEERRLVVLGSDVAHNDIRYCDTRRELANNSSRKFGRGFDYESITHGRSFTFKITIDPCPCMHGWDTFFPALFKKGFQSWIFVGMMIVWWIACRKGKFFDHKLQKFSKATLDGGEENFFARNISLHLENPRLFGEFAMLYNRWINRISIDHPLYQPTFIFDTSILQREII